jgi:ATP-dependent helicase HrpB
VDLALRVELVRRGVASGAGRRIQEVARQIARAAGIPRADAPADAAALGIVLAEAYPDRVAQRRPGAPGSFRLANGRGAVVDPGDPLAGADFLAVADLDGAAQNARVFLAARLDRQDLEAAFADRIVTADESGWDGRTGIAYARRLRRLDALVIEERPLPPGEVDLVPAVVEGLRAAGIEALPWTDGLRQWRARVGFAARLEPDAGWPDVSDEALLETLEDWLAPHLGGITRADQFRRIDLGAALKARLDWAAGRRLDALAPETLAVPSGFARPLDYAEGEVPVLAVKLQEMFGARAHPCVGDGRVPVVIHLLSPAGRPIAVTRDIASFWSGAYAEVRKDLRGRYPKHPWPEDPLTAPATARAKPRGT